MKIIYDNIIFSLQKAGGISVYWSELIKRAKNYDLTLYGFGSENIFEDTSIIKQKESSLPIKIARYLSFQKKLPKNSIFHSSYYRIAKQKDIVNITTVHDFTYEYYKTGLARLIHSYQKAKAIKKSDGIICVSQNTKKDLLKFYPNIKEEKIKVIYNGVSKIFCKLENPKEELEKRFKTLENKKYILFIGDRSPYKNFNMAANVVQNIPNTILVIVSGKNLSNDEKQTLKNNYQHYQNINGQDLNILYNNAFCLLYPSYYEGFGIPIIEAMKSGCPVVSTNLSSIPEISQNAALLVDNVEKEEFIKAIKKLENQTFKEELLKKAHIQAQNFSWDKCFEETIKFYEEIKKKKIK